ncbi:MAG TPA: hypothetical protein VHL59_07280 [Thermoanaerobaculia bacterium]|nr:hypothetical protein [Thermoanaerobaculia bacterium]
MQKEIERRKRALSMFLALLLLPLIVGGWALVRAPKETELVAREVTPIVRQEVSRSIESSVTEAVAEQAAPVIRQTVSEQFSETVLPQIGAVKEEVSGMRQTMQENSRRITEASSSVATIRGEQATVVRGGFAREQQARESLRRTVAAVQQDLTTKAKTLDDLDQRVQRIEGQLAAIQRELKVLQNATRGRQPIP